MEILIKSNIYDEITVFKKKKNKKTMKNNNVNHNIRNVFFHMNYLKTIISDLIKNKSLNKKAFLEKENI